VYDIYKIPSRYDKFEWRTRPSTLYKTKYQCQKLPKCDVNFLYNLHKVAAHIRQEGMNTNQKLPRPLKNGRRHAIITN
jgi:hypothetical protein